MDDPQPTPPPSPASPFQPERVRRVMQPGCAKPVAIGCTAMLLLAMVGATYMASHYFDLLALFLSSMKASVQQQIPPETSTEERARFDLAFEQAIQRARAGNLDLDALQLLQRRFLKMAGRGTAKMSPQQFGELLTAVEELARAGVPAAPSP